MAEEYKSSKTRQVMNLINAGPSGANPFLPADAADKEARTGKRDDSDSVESKLRDYTESKRGFSSSKFSAKVKRNPMLNIPEEDEIAEEPQVKRSTLCTEQVTIDVNRVIIDEILDDALRRFNTCHCEKCRNIITEKVLEQVPVKIVTVSPDEEKSVVDSYCSYARKDIYSAIVKTVLANKRRPFHGD
ncbi:MAG: hypothetical protein ACI4JI_01410 [Ruminiclostridium sp.]